jgi:outer membrane lipoprotein-sorting protein
MKTLLTLLASMAALAVVAADAPAAQAPSTDMTVDEIVNRANLASYYQGNDGKARVHMTITDSQGNTRTRDFIILRKDEQDGGEQMFYVYFDRPADLRRMVFMVHKHIDKDDDRWLYMPALDLVKRLVASDKRTSFANSDFYYEDVSGRNPALDNHKLVETSDNFYVLESTPKDPSSVEFSKYKTYVHRQTFLPLKSIFYDKNGNEHRIIEALKVEQIQGHPTVVESRVTDKKTGSKTVDVMSDIAYDVGLTDDIFTERYLRTRPAAAR